MNNLRHHYSFTLNQIWRPLLAGVLIVLLVIIWYVAAPWPHWVRVVNVGSRSLSVGWVTRKPISGCVVVSEGKGFSRKNRSVCSYDISTTHLIRVDDLDEDTEYQVMVRQGWRPYPSTLEKVKTYLAKPNVPAQVPGYGTVVDERGGRIPGALVYAYPAGGGNQYPEATIANDQGNYALDLGFFGPIEEYVVEGGSGPDLWNAMIMSGKTTTPFPPLEAISYE